MEFWPNNVLDSVGNVALLDCVLLLPHRDGKSVGGCLAVSVTSSCGVLANAANLSIGGDNVLSLLRVEGPVGCASVSSSSLSESELCGS